VQVVQIDIAKFNIWLTNTATRGGVQVAGYPWNYQCGGSDGAHCSKGHPIDSIYVYNAVTPIRNIRLPSVRVVNGGQLPSAKGLTIATAQPLYVLGNYNIQTNSGGSQSINTANTAWTYPAALMGDAISILSGNWNDANSLTKSGSSYNPPESGIGNRVVTSNITVNAACLAGIVPSTKVGTQKQYSGGLENFLRLNEDWSSGSRQLWYNGSIVAMFPSIYATNFWIGPADRSGYPTHNYTVPQRKWAFDAYFLVRSRLPPLTPLLGSSTNPPIIIVQPQSQTVPSGNTAMFSVTTIGPLPLSYQWNFNGTNLDGATNTSLTLTNVQFDQAGNYTVLVTNAFGSILSSNTVLTVTATPPTIQFQPTNQTVFVNGTATFSVTATGSLPLSYQWSFGGMDIDGATNALLTLTNVQTNQAGNYVVQVANAFGSTNSTSVTLTVVWLPPTIQKQPTNQTVVVGNTVVFSVTATGSWPLSYQWSFNGTNLAGATNTTLTLSNVQLTDSGDYVVQVTNLFGSTNSATAVLLVGLPPTIVIQPTNQTVMSGDTAVLSVTASGSNPLSYQWRFNGTNLAGATNTTLILTNVQFSQSGNYAVLVTNAFGSILSSNAALTVQAPPFITSQPTNQTVVVGDTAIFNVTATGSSPLSYQWNFNGTNLDGATNASLSLTNVQLNQAGDYAVLVTNTYGSILSSNALLTVNPPSPCVDPPNGLVAWWQAEDNANDSVGTNNGTLVSGITFTDGKVGQGFHLNGTNQYIQIADSTSLKPTDVTVEAWVRLDVEVTPNAGNPGLQYIVFKKNTRNYNFEGYTLLKNRVSGQDIFSFAIASAGGGQIHADSTTVPQVGVWYHVAGTYDSSSGYLKLYVNGVQEGSAYAYAGFPLNYGTRPIFIGTTGESFDGKLEGTVDEVSIYSRALSTNEIQAIYNARSNGKCALQPTLIVQPTDQTISVGGNAAFNVTAIGSQPLSYQWQWNGTNLDSATNATLTLSNVTEDQAGNYSVQVANTAGSIVSSNAVLTVLVPPSISIQPAGCTNVAGGAANFNVVADGTAPLSYQWQWNGTNLVDATNATLTLNSITMDLAGSYSVTVANIAGSVTSSNAVLSVYATTAAMLGGYSLSAANGFRFQIAGVPGFNYAVQASTNLIDWVSLVTNTSPFGFVDVNTTNFPQQFYRAIYLP
jgi:hypothetical protein